MQENEPWQEIRTDVRSLYADHLGHALDLLHESLADGDPQLGIEKTEPINSADAKSRAAD